jgi:DNA-directed RNA polymerase subunit K
MYPVGGGHSYKTFIMDSLITHTTPMVITMSDTRFEKARIVGARALQISLGAPILVDSTGMLDPVDIAMKEYDAGVIPITVTRD